MPTESEQLNGLSNEVWQLAREWNFFEQLRRHSNERCRILNGRIPVLVDTLQIAIANNVVTTLCKLAECETKTKDRNKETLTLSTLVSTRVAASSKLQKKMDELDAVVTGLRPYRNKIGVHRDKAVANGENKQPVNIPQIQQIAVAVQLAQDVVTFLTADIDTVAYSFGNVGVEHEMNWLVGCIAFGERHKEEIAKIKQNFRRDPPTV